MYKENFNKSQTYDSRSDGAKCCESEPNCRPEEFTATDHMLEKFGYIVDKLSKNVSTIDSKLYLLLSYSEPSIDEKCGIEKAPDCFLDKLNSLSNSLESINSRLDYCNRHLNHII